MSKNLFRIITLGFVLALIAYPQFDNRMRTFIVEAVDDTGVVPAKGVDGVGTRPALSWLIASNIPPVLAQAVSEWTLVDECLPAPQPRPDDYRFPGFIASYVPGDGIRALRAETFTTYYLAFAGSNFIEAAAFSPDGRWLALPYGYIETAAAFDVRYRVGELRVMSTGTFPQISARLPWQASFQQGALARIGWLDSETFTFAQGSFLDGQTLQQVQPFTGEISPFAAGAYDQRSPDGTRGFQSDADRLAMLDLTDSAFDRTVLAHFPAQQASFSGIVWSPDSSQLAALEAEVSEVSAGESGSRWLSLYSRNGDPVAQLFDLTDERLLTNFRWSPDGAQFAFAAYNPYDDESMLYIGDVAGETLRATCVLLNTLYTRSPEHALAWSPDNSSLALTLRDGLHIYDSTVGALYRIGADIGGLMEWKPGE